jgi:hypothetical protein
VKLARGTRVRQYRDGDRIVEPVGRWPRTFLAALGAYPDEIPRPTDEHLHRDLFERRKRRR